MKKQSLAAYALIAAAALAYFLSLWLPALVYRPHLYAGETAPVVIVDSGADVLALGWIGLYMLNLAWCANLVGLGATAAAVFGRASKAACITAVAAFAVGLHALAYTGRPVDQSGHDIAIDHLGAGFYLWEASFLLLALSQALAWRVRPKAEAG